MAKQLVFSDEARRGILEGVTLLSKAVKATLGPKGRNVVIDKKFGAPAITKDGVTVAKEIELKCPYANMGAQMVKDPIRWNSSGVSKRPWRPSWLKSPR